MGKEEIACYEQFLLLTHQQQKAFENIMGKEEIAHNLCPCFDCKQVLGEEKMLVTSII